MEIIYQLYFYDIFKINIKLLIRLQFLVVLHPLLILHQFNVLICLDVTFKNQLSDWQQNYSSKEKLSKN